MERLVFQSFHGFNSIFSIQIKKNYMDPDSQTDKPPQEDFQTFTNFLGTVIALMTLVTPVVSIVLFSAPASEYRPLRSSNVVTPRDVLSVRGSSYSLK